LIKANGSQAGSLVGDKKEGSAPKTFRSTSTTESSKPETASAFPYIEVKEVFLQMSDASAEHQDFSQTAGKVVEKMQTTTPLNNQLQWKNQSLVEIRKAS